MPLQSIIINDQETAFLVVAVPKLLLDDHDKAEQTIQFLQARGNGLPVALVTCNESGAPTAYYGRGDLALRLVRRPATTMVWRDLPLA